jgi:hypothetical protein
MPRKGGKLLIAMVVLAFGVLLFSRRAGGGSDGSVMTLVGVLMLVLAVAAGVYRYYTSRARQSQLEVAKGLEALARGVGIQYRPADRRQPHDYGSASGEYRGVRVQVCVDTDDEAGFDMGVRLFPPELDDRWLYALSRERVPRVRVYPRPVGEAWRGSPAAGSDVLASSVAEELAALARQVTAVELDVGSMRVLVKNRKASFWTEHTMETDPERLRTILDGAVDVASRLRPLA